MPLLGAHMSIAGGYYKAVNAAAELGMETVQIFTKNNNQWRAKALTDEDVRLFKEAMEETGLRVPCAHDSYLINVGSPNEELWQKSLDALVVEMERAEALGLAGVVMHPGSYVDSSEEAGLKQIIKALNEAIKRTKGFAVEFWLENTAGQGTNLGYRFEHLATLIDGVKDNSRIGVCIDTCHTFAAGYGLKSKAEYKATMDELDNVVGLDRIRAFHVNDSKKPQGSRVDRHDHIGEGELGLEPFRHVLNDRRFKNLPMYLETKKEDRDGEPMDAVNLRTLRSLTGQ
ncbi:MAG: deoxyribonuclease IV [Planctomycetaceae bacterium]|nr:deoxyribonuclease IV [Planctomycetaceae bacterium]